MTPELDNLRHVVLTSPRDSAQMLYAIYRLMDLGMCCLADEALDEREQVEAVEDEGMARTRRG